MAALIQNTLPLIAAGITVLVCEATPILVARRKR
jgi:hypothetical protein